MRDLTRQEAEDLGVVASTPAGRRTLGRYIFGLGNLSNVIATDKAHDGICKAILEGEIKGIRAMAATMDDELQKYHPNLWDLMVTERTHERAAALAALQTKKQGENDD